MTGRWPADIEELLAVYALDAVDEHERLFVERYLLNNPSAAAEVASYREALTYLQPGTIAPPGLWDRIAQDLTTAAPPLNLDAFRASETTPRRQPVALFALGATVALLVALGGVLFRGQHSDRRSFDAVAAAIARESLAARRDSQARMLLLRDGSGTVVATGYLAHGDLLLSDSDLPTLARDRTYQLWCLHDAAVSLAVLGPQPAPTKLHLDSCDGEMAITNERAGGASQPSSDRVASGKPA